MKSAVLALTGIAAALARRVTSPGGRDFWRRLRPRCRHAADAQRSRRRRRYPCSAGAANRIGQTPLAAVRVRRGEHGGRDQLCRFRILGRKFGDKVYIRPGVGIAVHTGSAANFEDPTNGKVDFGSRVLFEPELAIGTQINDRMTLEASWVHMSHGSAVRKAEPRNRQFRRAPVGQDLARGSG